MPTIAKIESFRFFFYAGDGNEPPHVHVEKEDKVAKFWLNPVRLHSSGWFNRHEIARLQKIIEENAEIFLRSWNEYFSN